MSVCLIAPVLIQESSTLSAKSFEHSCLVIPVVGNRGSPSTPKVWFLSRELLITGSVTAPVASFELYFSQKPFEPSNGPPAAGHMRNVTCSHTKYRERGLQSGGRPHHLSFHFQRQSQWKIR